MTTPLLYFIGLLGVALIIVVWLSMHYGKMKRDNEAIKKLLESTKNAKKIDEHVSALPVESKRDKLRRRPGNRGRRGNN